MSRKMSRERASSVCRAWSATVLGHRLRASSAQQDIDRSRREHNLGRLRHGAFSFAPSRRMRLQARHESRPELEHDLMRPSKRQSDEMRAISFERGVSKHAEGSCLVKFGDTHVLCTASLEEKVPGWMRNTGKGWVTAEYGMLPRSTGERMRREASAGKQGGRTLEIQRLIGRCLRAVVDLQALGEQQITVDCDVIQADGGTRTASITGGWVALHDCLRWMEARQMVSVPRC